MVLVFKTLHDADFAAIQLSNHGFKILRSEFQSKGVAIEVAANPDEGLELDLEKLGLQNITTIII